MCIRDSPLIEVKPYHAIQSVESTGHSSTIKIRNQNEQIMRYPCDLVIWANARDARQFIRLPIPFKPVRGQVTMVKGAVDLNMPICGDAYVAPAWNGVMTCGATYTPNSDDLTAYHEDDQTNICLLYTSPSPRDRTRSRMPSSA